MRRLLTIAVAAIVFAAISSVASAEREPALTYRTEDNVADAWFGDGLRSVSVRIEESVRPDQAYSYIWVRAAVANYDEPFVFCNGDTDSTGVNAYYFRNTGAYFDATIPFHCADGTGPFDVRVVARWDTAGPVNISTSTISEIDDMGLRRVQTIKYSIPDVTRASVEMDFNPFPVPDFSYGDMSLRTLHAVYPQPEELP